MKLLSLKSAHTWPRMGRGLGLGSPSASSLSLAKPLGPTLKADRSPMALPEAQCPLGSEGNRSILPGVPGSWGWSSTPFFRSGYRCGFTGNRGSGQQAWHPTAASLGGKQEWGL